MLGKMKFTWEECKEPNEILKKIHRRIKFDSFNQEEGTYVFVDYINSGGKFTFHFAGVMIKCNGVDREVGMVKNIRTVDLENSKQEAEIDLDVVKEEYDTIKEASRKFIAEKLKIENKEKRGERESYKMMKGVDKIYVESNDGESFTITIRDLTKVDAVKMVNAAKKLKRRNGEKKS